MPQGKRKRKVDGACMLFPDEEQQDEGISKVVTAPESLSKAWERCGEGFDGYKARKLAQSSERKTHALHHLEQSFISEDEISVSESLKDPGDIIWSDSDLSNDGSREPSKFRAGKFGYNDASISAAGYSGDDSPQIDLQEASDIDSDDKSSMAGAAESAVEISDSESSTSDVSRTLPQCDVEAASAVDIAEYSSDDLDEKLTLDEDPPRPTGNEEVITPLVGKSASDWVRTAQVLLQTPEKMTTKAFKTPEDSAKKRKRFLGGGLAERLSRLQNRERSAVSFWRHQRDSDCKMPSGDKCGILMLKIIEVHEECSMQVALCQKLLDPSSSVTSSSTDCSPVKMLKVLFTCHTAAQLKGQPDDIIHIHPPWLKLNLRNESIPVILNTHFTQRVTGNVKDSKDRKGSAVLPDRRRPVPLSLVFKIDTEPDNKSKCEEPQKARSCQEQPSTLNFTVNDSLLDVVETQGAAGWSETSICVVVQRVYGLPSRDGLGLFPQGSNKAGSNSRGNSDRTIVRLCLLIQDAYGIFSELQLQCNYVTAADIENYSSRWEGRACCLSGMKILQRTTRGRAPGLFSLIDSLWPPLLPIKIHGQDQGQVHASLPPPSFCYILAVHHSEGGDRIQEEDKISDFYLPPVVHTLDKILQVVDILQRCSFWATVIYMKPETIHSDSSPQEDTWMFVTDVTLQHTSEGLLRPRVLAVCIPPSCVLDLNLLQTLCGNLPRTLYFKDTVKENGRIICIERTVLSLQKPLLSYAAGVSEPTGPVILDELDSRTEANSLCSVKGIIIGVNERASFSWPACNKCGSNKLQQSAGNSSSTGMFFCTRCSQNVSSPIIRMQLEVFLHCESVPAWKVKLKLLQNTISLLLSLCSSKDGRYEVSGVIGREVGPLDCFVQAWSGHPDSSLALEEICLASPGSG